MILLTAKPMLVQERMDWNRAHLPWIPSRIYRLFSEARHGNRGA